MGILRVRKKEVLHAQPLCYYAGVLNGAVVRRVRAEYGFLTLQTERFANQPVAGFNIRRGAGMKRLVAQISNAPSGTVFQRTAELIDRT